MFGDDSASLLEVCLKWNVFVRNKMFQYKKEPHIHTLQEK